MSKIYSIFNFFRCTGTCRKVIRYSSTCLIFPSKYRSKSVRNYFCEAYNSTHHLIERELRAA